MNERIKELAEQCESFGSWDNKTYSFDKEKFAQLIVKECARVQHKRFCEHGDVSWDILMEYFGVKP
jgi:hypothetical protein